MLVIGAVFVDVKGFSFGTYVPEGTNIGDVQIVKVTSRDPEAPPLSYVKVSGGMLSVQ